MMPQLGMQTLSHDRGGLSGEDLTVSPVILPSGYNFKLTNKIKRIHSLRPIMTCRLLHSLILFGTSLLPQVNCWKGKPLTNALCWIK